MSNKKEISSGAQKAEALADNSAPKKTAKSNVKKSSAPVKKAKAVKDANVKKSDIKPDVKKKDKKIKKDKKHKKEKVLSEKQLKKREAREQKKLQMAKIRAEKKQRRLEKKLEAKQKRLDKIAAFKQAKAERREKRRERRDMLKHESKDARIERKKHERLLKVQAKQAKRKAALAEKQARREHRLKVREQKRAEKIDKRHAPGFGGWLAAVISLGVTTLALGTMLTFGWMNMNGMQDDAAMVQTHSLYELNSIVDNLDTNLAKARVSSSQNEQVRILSEIAVESQIAETVLERLPLDITMTNNITSFVNKMGDSAQSMLYSVASGKKLTDSQIATINHMYNVNAELKQMLNELTSQFSAKDMLNALRGKDNLMFTSFGDLENVAVETPKEINDGPFAENIEKSSPKNLDGMEEITSAKAEELARQYFASYEISDAKCTGEVAAQQLGLYNVCMTTREGEMTAQISKQGGKVVEFNSYKECTDNNFSVERCIDIAEDFLNNLGFTDMKPVWTSENGTTCNLNFAYEQDGVVLYPDMVKIKVCEQRGIVTGMEALAYVLNHTDRDIPDAKITKSDAAENIMQGFETEGSRLCIIPVDGEEVLCYEFYGNYSGCDYYIYIDANTGNEVQIFTVIGTKQGKALM